METFVIHAPDMAAVWQQLAAVHATSMLSQESLRTLLTNVGFFLALFVPVGNAMALAAAAVDDGRHSFYMTNLNTAHNIEPTLSMCMAIAVVSLAMVLVGAIVPVLDDESLLFYVSTGLVLASVLHSTLHLQLPSSVFVVLLITTVGVVYPAAAVVAWSSNGWFNPLSSNALFDQGAIDMGGTGVVHITLGSVVLAAMLLLPDALQTVQSLPVHDHLDVTSTVLVGVGWLGLLMGHTAAALSASTAGLATLARSLGHAVIGATGGALVGVLAAVFLPAPAASSCAMAGYVAVAGAAGLVEPIVALFLGGAGASVYLATAKGVVNLQRLRVPSCYSDAVAIHLGVGAFGTIVGGLCAVPARYETAYALRHWGGYGRQLGLNLLYALVAVAWATVVTTLVLLPVRHVRHQADAAGYTEMDEFKYASDTPRGDIYDVSSPTKSVTFYRSPSSDWV
ncbi:hypothetical protein ACHHYP_16093 [Achlya hypogyna]|uniref:Ammonium transporter AmtB-like domain-containing protein n=1 Tax=Achlya hypogyna TaxID=1202772 RepID=A0A1V9ZEC7_ACHHY|nr:hypothetical protein ACHHYP_16093 [Achlya hypogyna]